MSITEIIELANNLAHHLANVDMGALSDTDWHALDLAIGDINSVYDDLCDDYEAKLNYVELDEDEYEDEIDYEYEEEEL